SARHLIARSAALRAAVESGDSAAAQTAARALIATHHMDSLTILRGGRVLARAGAVHALAPISGEIVGASGATAGRFIASVWADAGLIAEATGLTGAQTVIRSGDRTVAGKLTLSRRALADSGTVTLAGKPREYTSFPAA